MNNDNKPDLRFAMISLEMTEEIADPTPAPPAAEAPSKTSPGVRVGRNGVECAKCGLCVFQPTTVPGVVVCLGCPDTPRAAVVVQGAMALLRELEAKTRLYRCGRCGVKRRVTIDISAVNLHCVDCRQLALHDRQPNKSQKKLSPESWRELLEESERVRVAPPLDWDRLPPMIPVEKSSAFSLNKAIEMMTSSIPVDTETKLNIDWGPPSIPYPIPYSLPPDDPLISDPEVELTAVGNSGDVPRVADAIREALSLEPFRVFERRIRSERFMEYPLDAAGVDQDYLSRGTGRTTEGIVVALAACVVGGARTLWVRSGAPRLDRIIDAARRAIDSMTYHELRRDLPSRVESAPPPLRWRGRRSTILLVDHSAGSQQFGLPLTNIPPGIYAVGRR